MPASAGGKSASEGCKEMHADAGQIGGDAAQTGTVAFHMKGKMRLITLDHIDGRTAAAKRARELMATIEADLGGADRLSEGSRQLVQRAAVLGTFIENCEAMWLAGETVELADYLAAINSQRRVLTTIGLERRAKGVAEMSLSDYLSSQTGPDAPAAEGPARLPADRGRTEPPALTSEEEVTEPPPRKRPFKKASR
jgi:hypothetical protein